MPDKDQIIYSIEEHPETLVSFVEEWKVLRTTDKSMWLELVPALVKMPDSKGVKYSIDQLEKGFSLSEVGSKNIFSLTPEVAIDTHIQAHQHAANRHRGWSQRHIEDAARLKSELIMYWSQHYSRNSIDEANDTMKETDGRASKIYNKSEISSPSWRIACACLNNGYTISEFGDLERSMPDGEGGSWEIRFVWSIRHGKYFFKPSFYTAAAVDVAVGQAYINYLQSWIDMRGDLDSISVQTNMADHL